MRSDIFVNIMLLTMLLQLLVIRIIWGTEQKSPKSPRRVFVLPFIEPVNILPNQTFLDTVPPDRSVWMFGKF